MLFFFNFMYILLFKLFMFVYLNYCWRCFKFLKMLLIRALISSRCDNELVLQIYSKKACRDWIFDWIFSRNKILGSGDACYHAYLVPWVPLFGIFSLWRPATSVKTNGYLRKMKINFFQNFFFVFWVKLGENDSAKKNWGPTLPGWTRRVRRCKNQVRIFLLFSTFWVQE